MRTAPTELDIELKELESRLERLRALYEQYFIGIERLEPAVPRRDVDRRIQALTRARIRNTAKRFKLQTIVQRYNTYQQYWARTCREIENGTYARHVARAKSRFGDNAGVGKAGGKSPNEEVQEAAERRVAANREAEEDLMALLQEDLAGAMDRVLDDAEAATLRPPQVPMTTSAIDSAPRVSPPLPPSPSSLADKDRVREALAANPVRRRAETRPEGHRPVAAPPPQPQPDAACRPVAEPQRAMSWSTLKAVEPGAAKSPRPAQPPPLERQRSSDPTPVASKSAEAPAESRSSAPMPPAAAALRAAMAASSAAARTGAEAKRRSVATRPELPAGQRTVQEPLAAKPPVATASQPVTAAAPKPAAQRGAPPPAAAAAPKPAAPRRARQPAAAKPARATAPKPAAATAPKPAAAKPAAQRRAPQPAAALSGSRMDALHKSLVSERGRLHQKGQVSRVALEKSLRATEAKLQQKYGGRKIDFQVIVKDGKAIVKPIVG